MKFFKLLFSRFSIIFLLVIIQATAFGLLLFYLQRLAPYFIAIGTLIDIIGILIVILLINRQINPNYIVPWIIIILILPFIGILIYLLFSQNRIGRKQKRLYKSIIEKSADYLTKDEEVFNKLKERDMAIYNQSRYLFNANSLPIYDKTHSQYFGSGESFFDSLIEQIKNAERFIFLEFFLIEKGYMWDSILDLLIHKVEQGVEVRVMYDDIGCISSLKSGYYKKLRNLGINAVKFNKFLPIVSAVHNNRNHRKVVIIDGKTAYVTGVNISDAYINVKSKYGYWKDSAIMLKGQAVKSLTIMFLTSFNAQTKKIESYENYLPDFDESITNESKDKDKDRDKDKDKNKEDLGFVMPFSDGPKPLYPERVAQNAILNLINQAKEYVYITTPYLIMDFQLTDAIKNAAKRGVDIRIVTPHIPDKKLVFLMTRSSYYNLIQAGVKIYEFSSGFMHAKNFLADSEVAIIGTINMDYRSLVHHFECGVWLYNTPSIGEIRADFDSIFEESKQIALEESKLKFFPKLAKNILQLFTPLL